MKVGQISAFLLCGFLVGSIWLCTGCSIGEKAQTKVRDLEFTVLSEEKIPKALLAEIQKRKAEPFTLAYSDGTFLYLAAGYGTKQGSGYRVLVDACYLTEQALYVDTCLMGPPDETGRDAVSYPYLVLKTEAVDKTVIFR